MRWAAVCVALLATLGCACNVTGSTSNSPSVIAGPNDYPVCADVNVDLGQIAANGALSGLALTQLQSDDLAATNPALKSYGKKVAGQSYGDEFSLSADLGGMAKVCHAMGLYPPQRY